MIVTQLNAVDIASYLAAGLLASSKLLDAAKPVWDRFPKWLAVAIPVFVLDIPQVTQALMTVNSGVGLTAALLTSVALLLPGIEKAEAGTVTVSKQ
jgi:hypothetical protein